MTKQLRIMLGTTTLLLIALALNEVKAHSGELTSMEDIDVRNFLYDVDTTEGKEEAIISMLEDLSDNRINITLVGWQYVHDEEGDIKKIKTLELVFNSEESGDDDHSLEVLGEENPDDLSERIAEIQNNYHELAAETGLDIGMSYEIYDDEVFEEDFQMFVDRDEVYIGFGEQWSEYFKTTKNAKPAHIESFVKKHHQKHTWDTAVLRYDENGTFIPEQSHIVPILIVTVSDIEDTPVEIVDKVVDVVGKAAAADPDGNITGEWFRALETHMPDYDWDIIEQPDSYYVTKDFSLTVSFNMFELYLREDYYIYAVKKNN